MSIDNFIDKEIDKAIRKVMAEIAVGKLVEIARYCNYRKANSVICQDILKIIARESAR